MSVTIRMSAQEPEEEDAEESVDRPDAAGHGPEVRAEWPTIQQVGQEYVEEVLRHTGGDKSEAARVLGIDRRSLYRWLASKQSIRVNPKGKRELRRLEKARLLIDPTLPDGTVEIVLREFKRIFGSVVLPGDDE